MEPHYSTSQIVAAPSAGASATNLLKSCRMSWFLVQQVKSKALSIIHSVDLVDGINADLYVNKTISFYRDQCVLEALILCASDNRQFIEDELKNRLLNERKELLSMNSLNNLPELYFLLQFKRNVNTIVHIYLKKSEIQFTSNIDLLNSKEILIEDKNSKRLATILHISADESEIKEESQLLRNKSIELTLDETTLNPQWKWLLVQYSDGLNISVYSIINENETTWKWENFYQEHVSYIQDETGLNIYQAVVLKRSESIDELELDLENIKQSTLISIFPLNRNENEM